MKMWGKSGKILIGVALVAGLAGCQVPPPPSAAKPPIEPLLGRTALGPFAAARAAQIRGDSRSASAYYLMALRHDPENVEMLQRTFTLLVAEGQVDQALSLSQRVLKFDPDAAIPLLTLGLKAARDNRWDDAERHFAAIPARGVFALLAPMVTAWAKAGQDLPVQALDRLAALGQKEGSGLDAVHAFHAALIMDLAGRDQTAEEFYVRALSGQAAVRTAEAAGAFFMRTGRPALARAAYDRYLDEHPGTGMLDPARLGPERAVPSPQAGLGEALYDLASVLRQGQAPDLALVFARLGLYVYPEGVLTRLMVGDLLAQGDRHGEAVDMYRAIPPKAAAYDVARIRAALNLSEAGDTAGALRELDLVAAAQPTSLDPLISKADLYRHQKQFAQAASAYGQAIALVPQPQSSHWFLFYARGICLERSKQWPQAEADFKRALALQPDQPDVLNYLGYSWVDKGLNLEQARAMLERAVSLRPRDGAIVDSLGWALYRLGDMDGAVRALERAADLLPSDPTINHHLGDALFRVGRADEAVHMWRRALTLDPEPEHVDELRRKVESGRLGD